MNPKGPPPRHPHMPKEALSIGPKLIGLINGWTEQIAAVSVTKASKVAPFVPGSIIHDNGCSAALTVTNKILALKPEPSDIKIYATDNSEIQLGAAKAVVAARGLPVEVDLKDARKLGDDYENKFTHSFTNFVIHVLQDRKNAAKKEETGEEAIKEIFRALKPNGTAIIATWRQAFNWEPVQEALKKTRGSKERYMPWFEEWLKPEKLQASLEEVGFAPENITLEPVTVTVEMESVEEYAIAWWSMFATFADGGWRESDQENWDEAIKIVTDGMKAHEDVQFDAAKGVYLMKQTATLAIAKKVE